MFRKLYSDISKKVVYIWLKLLSNLIDFMILFNLLYV